MSTTCTRCEGTGYLNIHQVPERVAMNGTDAVDAWIKSSGDDHDVTVCDCCGDGENWYGLPGEHYTADDPPGPHGPYASNGGLCHCH